MLLFITGCTTENSTDMNVAKASSTAKNTLLLYKNVEEEYGDLYVKTMGQAEEKVASNVQINQTFLDNSTDIVYFVDTEKNFYKFSRGKDKEKIASDVEYYTMEFDNVFYTNSNSDLFIVHASMETEKIGNEIGQYHLIDSDLIYINKDDTLKTYNIEEKTEVTIASDVYAFKVLSSKKELLYTNNDDISYYVKGSNEAIKLAVEQLNYLNLELFKGALYFINYSEDETLYKVSLLSDDKVLKISSNVIMFKIYEDLIYYISDDYNLFVKSEKNLEAKKLASDVSNFMLQDDFLYFENSDGVYKQSLKDGAAKTKIAEAGSNYSIAENNKVIQASTDQALYVDDIKLTNDLNNFSVLEDSLVYSTNDQKLYLSAKFGSPTVVEEDLSDYDYIFYNNENVYSNTLKITNFVGYWEYYDGYDLVHLEIVNNEQIRVFNQYAEENYPIRELYSTLEKVEIVVDEGGIDEVYAAIKQINSDSFIWYDYDNDDEYEFNRVTKEQAMSYY